MSEWDKHNFRIDEVPFREMRIDRADGGTRLPAPSSTCSCCGKALTDPVSVSVGMGPVCRIEKKNNSVQDKTANMFSNHAEYDWDVTDDGVIWMRDLDKGWKSLTNDMDHALATIKEMGFDLSKYRIMYCDSMGIWDEVRITNPATLAFEFRSLNQRTWIDAKAVLLGNQIS